MNQKEKGKKHLLLVAEKHTGEEKKISIVLYFILFLSDERPNSTSPRFKVKEQMFVNLK